MNYLESDPCSYTSTWSSFECIWTDLVNITCGAFQRSRGLCCCSRWFAGCRCRCNLGRWFACLFCCSCCSCSCWSCGCLWRWYSRRWRRSRFAGSFVNRWFLVNIISRCLQSKIKCDSRINCDCKKIEY